jgi:hypothetical protein
MSYGFKLTPFAQPLTLEKDQIKLGDIEGQTPLSFLLELNITPQSSETKITLPLKFLADIPSRGIRNRAFSDQFQLLVVANAPRAKPSSGLIKAVRMLNMYHEETQRLRRMGTLSEEGRKRLKYGTRALLNETMSRMASDE